MSPAAADNKRTSEAVTEEAPEPWWGRWCEGGLVPTTPALVPTLVPTPAAAAAAAGEGADVQAGGLENKYVLFLENIVGEIHLWR